MLDPENAFFRYVRNNKKWEKGERKKGQARPQTHFQCCDAWSDTLKNLALEIFTQVLEASFLDRL